MSEAGSVAIQHQLNANYYLNTASFTLLFYDYLLTLPLETARFWPAASRHRVSAVNVLFFVNRYGTLFGNIPVVMQYFWTGRPSAVKLSTCISLHTYHQYFAVVTQIIIGIMLILRTYALYERNRRVLTLMVCVAAAVIAVGAWAVLAPTHVPEDAPRISLYIGCFSAVNESQTTRLAIAWGGMGVFDSMIFLLTLYRALSRHIGRGGGRGSELVGVLLRDGSIYFGVILLSTISNILTFVLAAPVTRGLPTTFTNVISSIMISRLMLNLRDPALASMSGRGGSTSRTQTFTAPDSVGMFSTYVSEGEHERGVSAVELQARGRRTARSTLGSDA